jgi:hypothetical protein
MILVISYYTPDYALVSSAYAFAAETGTTSVAGPN